MKFKKRFIYLFIYLFFFWGGGGVGSGWGEVGSGWWGQGGCERRIEIVVEIKKKLKIGGRGRVGGGGVRVDVNGELKFL